MEYVDNLIIGAGAAGLQAGYFLKKLDLNYKIIERNENAGSFFQKYPISGELISFNKRFNGKDGEDFNMRYDWHSFLNDEGLKFTSYSNDFYPKSADFVRYMQDFSKQLNVEYNCEVLSVDKVETDSSHFSYIVNTKERKIHCKKLIMATGMIPKKTNHLNYGDLTSDFVGDWSKFDNKVVFIVGSGNSAYEVGKLLSNHASSILISGKKTKFTTFTHYSGHLRGNNLFLLDTFSLKSLNAIGDVLGELSDDIFVKDNEINKYKLKTKNFKFEIEIDYIIYCTGFETNTSILNFNVEKTERTYPCLDYKYMSINNENLFFVGALMHGNDFEKSSGGFLHGFRYLIKFFVESVYSNYQISMFDSKLNLAEFIFSRIKNASSIFLMYYFMCDIIYKEDGKYIIIPDVTLEYVKTFKKDNFIIINLVFGNELKNFDNLLAPDRDSTIPRFLHVKFTVVDKENTNIIRTIEDEIGTFERLYYYNRIKTVIDIFL